MSKKVFRKYVRSWKILDILGLIVIFRIMNFDTAVFSAITFASILFGGYVSFKFKDRLHFVMAFAAGVLL